MNDRPTRLRRRANDGWEVWSLRRPLLVYVLAVQLAALIVTISLSISQRVELTDLAMLAGIVALGMTKEELTRHVERTRRRFSDTPYQNMTSVWTLAAALVLPIILTAIVVVVLYGHLWLRTWRRVRTARAWKVIFSASTVVLSCHAATSVSHLIGRTALADATAPRTVALLLLAVLLYSVVNLGLVAFAYALMTTERTARRLLGTLNDAMLEYATLAMGALAAILLLRSPLLVIFLIPVLVVLHNSVLIRQLQEASSTDPKTGLLNTAAWLALARREFERASRESASLGLLTLDLDHLKRINDSYGDRFGDTVLHAVAEAIRCEVREEDLVGRYYEKFVVLCSDLTIKELSEVGERVRAAVARLEVQTGAEAVTVTVSVGVAHYPGSTGNFDELLVAAGIALFAAKDSGRNRVAMRLDRRTEPVQDSSDSPTSSA
jgi:diguanylate cyclase (GGDEF)-like protein